MMTASLDGEIARASPMARGLCPMCGARVIAKCGRKVAWHWAHERAKDCDSWGEGETDWHMEWKSRFAAHEKVIEVGGERHRADAISSDGRVIEFQHSTITAAEIHERQEFYRYMIWVVDCREAFESNRIGLKYKDPKNSPRFCTFRWNHRRRSFDSASLPLFLDIGMAFFPDGEPFSGSVGTWQETTHENILIDVRQWHGRHGWGYAMTHQEFCEKFGACDVPEAKPLPGLMLSSRLGLGFAYHKTAESFFSNYELINLLAHGGAK